MLFILELVWLVIGSVWVTNEYKDCDWIVVTTVRVLVGLAWVGVMVFIFMFGEFYIEDFLDPLLSRMIIVMDFLHAFAIKKDNGSTG